MSIVSDTEQIARQRGLAQVALWLAVLTLVVTAGSLAWLPYAAALGQWIVIGAGGAVSAAAFAFGVATALRRPVARLLGIVLVAVVIPAAALFGLVALVVEDARWLFGGWTAVLAGSAAFVAHRLVRWPTGVWDVPKSGLGVFISYRRQDSGRTVGRVHDHLRRAFEEEHLFLDVDRQAAGEDYRVVIGRALEASDIVLAVIGTGWLTVLDAQGRRRLDDPDDMVRIELETALSRDLRVIPVLVEVAAMPRPADVPSSLEPLCYKTAVVVRPDPDFTPDMQRLIAGMRAGERREEPSRRRRLMTRTTMWPGQPRGGAP